MRLKASCRIDLLIVAEYPLGVIGKRKSTADEHKLTQI